MIEIDGSHGEGGGQILRTSLALSAVLNRPITVYRIRAGRKNPGLQAQHLKAVRGLAKITHAQVEGADFGSEKITFVPGQTIPGDYRIEVETAGSVSLVLQALLLPLCLSRKRSRLTLVGGTHVPWSPPFHYLTEILFPALAKMGIRVKGEIEQWGWYPRGGGVIRVEIEPASGLHAIVLRERGELKRISGISASSNLPKHVTEKQRDYAIKKIKEEMKMDVEIECLDHVPAQGRGSFVFLKAEFEKTIAGFSSFGEKGKPAEMVSDEAFNSLKGYIGTDGCIDPHLADQLIPFMAMVEENSSFTTSRVTSHLVTNLWVIRHFLEMDVAQYGKVGDPGGVQITNR